MEAGQSIEALNKTIESLKTQLEQSQQSSEPDTGKQQMTEMKAKYEAQVKRMDKRLGDAVKKIKSLNLDIEEYREMSESKDYEIKLLNE